MEPSWPMKQLDLTLLWNVARTVPFSLVANLDVLTEPPAFLAARNEAVSSFAVANSRFLHPALAVQIEKHIYDVGVG